MDIMESMDEKESLISMIESCFAYGEEAKNSRSYDKYIKPFKDEMSEIEFNSIYEDTIKDLKENYVIKKDVYIDSEGCSYNELVKRS